jgi:glycosyltransferase involved in cell wall biosynthesis
MIKIDKIDEGLPISVIVPLSKNRREFFNNMTLPLIEANNPIEIIINDDEGSAPKKRNAGYKKSTQPFLFFIDDDILLPSNYLKSLYDALIKNSNVGFAYTGYRGIVLHPESHPIHGNFQIPAIEFNTIALKQGNYISTMSLLRRELFPGFDENLKRLQDWSLWLTIVENGGKGILVPNLTFYAYYLDSGITSNTNSEIDAINAIRIKHKL